MAETTAEPILSDRALLRLYFESGQHQAFAELVNRLQHTAYRTAFARTGNREQAEEAVQEAFIKLAGAPGRRAIDEPGELRFWFMGVVSNTAKHASRSERRAARRTEAARAKQASVGSEQPLAANGAGNVDADTRALLEEAISRLQEHHRQPLILFFIEKLNQREIARLIGVNQSSVARRIDEALNQLRLHLRQTGVECAAVALPAMLSASNLFEAPEKLQRLLLDPGLLQNVPSAASVSVKAAATAKSGKLAVAAVLAFATLAAGTLYVVLGRNDSPDRIPAPSSAAQSAAKPQESASQPGFEERRWDFRSSAFEDELPRTAGWVYGKSQFLDRMVLGAQGKEDLRYFLQLPVQYGRTMRVDVYASAAAQGRQLLVPVWVDRKNMCPFDYYRIVNIHDFPARKLVLFRFYIKNKNVIFCDIRNLETPAAIQTFSFSGSTPTLALCCANWLITEISVREIKDDDIPQSFRQPEKLIARSLELQRIMGQQLEFVTKRSP